MIALGYQTLYTNWVLLSTCVKTFHNNTDKMTTTTKKDHLPEYIIQKMERVHTVRHWNENDFKKLTKVKPGEIDEIDDANTNYAF